MNRFTKHPLIKLLCAAGLIGVSTQAMASAFQIWEQDGASVGNYHAGYAAEASDASIAWYNPAGITRFKNQQAVFSAVGIFIDFKYKGDVSVTEPSLTIPAGIVPVTASFSDVSVNGGTSNLVPSIHYVAPISDQVGFGLSLDVPFGLRTDYGNDTPLRYAGTLTSLKIINLSPALGFKLTDKASFGVGLDIQRGYADFDLVAGLIQPNPFKPKVILTEEDTSEKNTVDDTGYGFHAGILYDINECTRVGLSYHSQVVHHFSGTSKFVGPIAELFNDGPIVASRSTANITLPPYTALSYFHQPTPKWAVMGSVIYTQWNVFKRITLMQAAGLAVDPDEPFPVPSNNIEVNIPEYYTNTVNVSVGANYYPTDKIIIRGGLGYDQSPVRKAYRNIQLPDGDRYAFALGGHYQVIKTVGLDVGWTYIYVNQTKVNPPAVVMGVETIATDGHATGYANVVSAQVTWDIV